jgi:hypothetical protein
VLANGSSRACCRLRCVQRDADRVAALFLKPLRATLE